MWENIANNLTNAFQPSIGWLPVAFQNSDLVGGELVIRHYKNTRFVVPIAFFSPDGILQDQSGIFEIVDEFTVKYTFSGQLGSGKYLFIFQFIYF